MLEGLGHGFLSGVFERDIGEWCCLHQLLITCLGQRFHRGYLDDVTVVMTHVVFVVVRMKIVCAGNGRAVAIGVDLADDLVALSVGLIDHLLAVWRQGEALRGHMLDDQTATARQYRSQLLIRPQHATGALILTGKSPVKPEEEPVLPRDRLNAVRLSRGNAVDHVARRQAHAEGSLFDALLHEGEDLFYLGIRRYLSRPIHRGPGYLGLVKVIHRCAGDRLELWIQYRFARAHDTGSGAIVGL